jgi:hypothetical protein
MPPVAPDRSLGEALGKKCNTLIIAIDEVNYEVGPDVELVQRAVADEPVALSHAVNEQLAVEPCADQRSAVAARICPSVAIGRGKPLRNRCRTFPGQKSPDGNQLTLARCTSS